MRRTLLGLVILVVFLGVSVSTIASPSSSAKFAFAHISDTHIASKKSIEDYQAVLKRLKKMGEKISFVINTGDVTSYGYPEEFEAYTSATREVLPEMKFYVTSGNHDTRWSNTGKQNFRKYIGNATRSFDYDGVHFVLIDSSMLIEQYGHIEQKDLDWLKNDLSRQPPNKPIIIGFHHPPFQGKMFLDNEYEFLNVIEPYNVPLVLCGHTHSKNEWWVNGTLFTTTDATYNRQGFRLIEFTSPTITLYSGQKNNPDLKKDITISTYKMQSPKIHIAPVDARTSYSLVVTAPGFESASFSIDYSREFTPMKVIRAGVFAEQIPYRELSPGIHRVVVKLNSAKYKEWRKMVKFDLKTTRDRILYTVPTKGAIQSSAIAVGERILFGSNDGYLYCIDSRNGNLLWRFKTGAEILAVPAVTGSKVYFGSLDGNFYALSIADGKMLWQYQVGAPVLASALVVDDRVFFGAGDFKMRALDSNSGNLVWEFKTGRLIKMRPAYAGGKIFFGSWDGYFYCLNAENGKLIWKKQISPTPLFAPATSNPIIVGNKIIFVSHNYITHCLDINTGDEIWNYPNTDQTRPSYNSGAYFNGAVFYGSITGHLDSFNVNDGKLRFATLLAGLSSPDPIFDSSPAIYNGIAIVGSVGGYLYGVDCQTGDLKWQFSIQDGAIFSSPIIYNGIIFVGTNGGKLYAIEPGSIKSSKHNRN